jgi:hypothetical protein
VREDFHKVIVEKPRWGSRMRNLKTGWSTRRYDPDEDVANPGVLALNRKVPRKEFSDRLGPLRRYLEGQIGRPWIKIEGEFRKALDTRTVIGRHLWNHALREVELECRITPEGRPVTLRGYPVRNLYVHPRTGLLLRPKPRRIDEHRARQKRMSDVKKIDLDASTRAEKDGDLWFLFIDTGRTEEVVETRKDRSGRKITVLATRAVIRKKQANTEEVRRIRVAIEAAEVTRTSSRIKPERG